MKLFQNLLSKEGLIGGSLGFIIGYGVFNILNFVYHFFAARILGPEDYSIVAALFSILYIIIIIAASIQTTIAKFVADLNAKKKFGEIHSLLRRSLRKFTYISLGGFVIYVLLSPWISSFLKISVLPIIIMGTALIFLLLLSINKGVLQGIHRYNALGVNLTIEGAAKVGLLFALVFFGFGINGAILAVTAAYIFAFGASFLQFKKKWPKPKYFDATEMYKYYFPVFVTMLSLILFYNVDVLLVKHFFTDYLAGLYGAVSLLGKAVFFGAIAISFVMFPKVADLYARKKPHQHLLWKSLLFTFFIGGIMVLIFYLFPELVLKVAFGAQFVSAANILGAFSVFSTLLAGAYIISLYKLSIGHKKFIYLLLFFNILEIIMITLFHDSLIQVTYLLAGLTGSLFLFLLAFIDSK